MDIAEDREVKAKGQTIWLYVYFGNLYLALCVCVCVCVCVFVCVCVSIHLLSMSQNARWVPHWEYHLCCLSPLNSRFLIHCIKALFCFDLFKLINLFGYTGPWLQHMGFSPLSRDQTWAP